MSSSTQLVTISAVAFTVTAATLYIIHRTTTRKERNGGSGGRKRSAKRKSGLWDGRSIWNQMRQGLVVRNVEECENAMMKLRQATEKVKVSRLAPSGDSGSEPHLQRPTF